MFDLEQFGEALDGCFLKRIVGKMYSALEELRVKLALHPSPVHDDLDIGSTHRARRTHASPITPFDVVSPGRRRVVDELDAPLIANPIEAGHQVSALGDF